MYAPCYVRWGYFYYYFFIIVSCVCVGRPAFDGLSPLVDRCVFIIIVFIHHLFIFYLVVYVILIDYGK